MTHTYVCHHAYTFACVTKPIRVCDMTQSYVSHTISCGIPYVHGSYTCVVCHTYDWIMSHMWSHVTHTNESCHTYAWVMYTCVVLHIRMSHVTHINGSHHTYECVTYMCVVSHQNPMSCHTYEWVIWHRCRVISHTRESHVTNTNDSRHTYECGMCLCVVPVHVYYVTPKPYIPIPPTRYSRILTPTTRRDHMVSHSPTWSIGFICSHFERQPYFPTAPTRNSHIPNPTTRRDHVLS